MPPHCRVRNLSELPGSSFEVEAHSNTVDVIWAVAHQVMKEIAENGLGCNYNIIMEGCTVEKFNRMHQTSFDGRGNTTLADDWTQDIDEIFQVLRCIDE